MRSCPDFQFHQYNNSQYYLHVAINLLITLISEAEKVDRSADGTFVVGAAIGGATRQCGKKGNCIWLIN